MLDAAPQPARKPAARKTAYRWLKWPLNIDDFAQPLRSLKAKQLFGSTEKGTYTINHLGLQRVAEITQRSVNDRARRGC